MKDLVVDASGTTGKQLVNHLLTQGNEVTGIVGPTQNLLESCKD